MFGNAARPPVTLRAAAAAIGAAALLFVELCSAVVYTDLWAVRVEGGEAAAKRAAERLGFTYAGEIMPGYYQFRRRDVGKRSTVANETHNSRLQAAAEVKWFEQQYVRKRVKRDLIRFNDPKWPSMWYLLGGGDSTDRSRLDMNIRQAWSRGYTGKGVVVTILDDGLETTHPDLERNFDPRASYDVNDRDSDPTPRYDHSNENRHGTRCAGEVAAAADNGICGVGVAHGASIGGIRMLDGEVTDSVEALALSYRRDYVDIYSASWGPDDDGKTVDGPASLARKAFREGVAKGRGGKGSIFIWASGNGGRDLDNCNCDGYTNSIYTLSISSATENGQVPWYSEACSSTLATTFSSGGASERQVITTDLRRSCTDSHTGTSASAPLAAGICALALQANPNLTWRDMQHIVVMTANPTGLQAAAGSDGWKRNGAGRNVSDNFGYGMMDAAAMINLALNWTTVPEQHVCEIKSQSSNELVQASGKLVVRLPVDGCSGDPTRYVRHLEHVQVKMSLATPRRGDISVYLTSPAGTMSTLLARRQNDNNKYGFIDWSFMTTHCWGELAQGIWHLEVHNGFRASTTLHPWSLILHGTSENPLQQQPLRVGASAEGRPGRTSLASAEDCESGFAAHGGQCLEKCPESYYALWKEEVGRGGRCTPCGHGCRTCRDASSRCLGCHVGHVPVANGSGCLPAAMAVTGSAESAVQAAEGSAHSAADRPGGQAGRGAAGASGTAAGNDRLSTGTLWWLMIVATLAVCVLLFLLVLLAMYYAHAQGYFCSDGSRVGGRCSRSGSSAVGGGGSSSAIGSGVGSSSCENSSGSAEEPLEAHGPRQPSDRTCLPRGLHVLGGSGVPLICAAHSSQVELVTSASFTPAYSSYGHLTRV